MGNGDSGQTARNSRRIDLVIIIDGTVADETDRNLIAEMAKSCLVNIFVTFSDWQIATVVYGSTEKWKSRTLATEFTNNPEIVEKVLNQLPKLKGKASRGEFAYEAILKAFSLRGFREDSYRILLVITPNQPAETDYTHTHIINSARQGSFSILVVSKPWQDVQREHSFSDSRFKAIALETGGLWMDFKSNPREVGRDFVARIREAIDSVQ